MAGLEVLNPKHEGYIKHLQEALKAEGYIVENWGLEHIAPAIRTSGISQDYSLEALELRTGFDLLVRCPKTGFLCELDGKTTMFRSDTHNVSIEVWPVCFGRRSRRPRLVVFEPVNDYGVWLDELDKSWLSLYFMPDRWKTATALTLSHYIQEFLSDIVKQPYQKEIPWNDRYASGDPFFIWPIAKIKSHGNPFITAIKKRSELIVKSTQLNLFENKEQK